MKTSIFKIDISISRPALAILLVVSWFTISSSFAASLSFNLTAKILPNGQVGYALNGSNGDEAVIPGPALFAKQGDVIHVSLANETKNNVGFNVPGLKNNNKTVTKLGQTQKYTIQANKSGTYVYHGGKKKMLGLFGAIIVDDKHGPVDSFVEGKGKITPVHQKDIDKQFVLYMVGSTFWGTEISGDGTQQKPLWANPLPAAVEDDIVRFHILSVGPGHTFHLHAHRWLKKGTEEVIDTKLLKNISDTHSFTVKAGTGVGPGSWQYHCHLFAHMEAGMHGNFRVDPKGRDGASVVGASPYGNILLGPRPGEDGLVTFEVSDEGGSWFRSARGDAIVGLPLDIKSRSLEVMGPNSSVNFVMSDTNGVHTISSLLWPTGAPHMPFNQSDAYRGGAIIKLETPGLYVFTCKVHPFMFAAVIVDDPKTKGLDLGNPKENYAIDLVTGIKGLPTNSDLAVRLLKTFFIATATDNWQDFKAGTWNLTFPNKGASVRISGKPFKTKTLDKGFVLTLSDLNKTEPLVVSEVPAVPGVGEVWVNTQFEKTAGK